MGALPEYRTRMLLERTGVPVVPGVFVGEGTEFESLPDMPVFLKAQIPGATSRKAQGLVRRVESVDEIPDILKGILEAAGGSIEGVLIAKGLDLKDEYYAACMLDHGSDDRLPGGVLVFSAEGGSGVEERTGSLVSLPFSLISPPSAESIREALPPDVPHGSAGPLASLLNGMIGTFLNYRLTVLEANPVGLLADGSVTVVDCRAEFEMSAVSKDERDLFPSQDSSASDELTPLERTVAAINAADPSGTGFFRQNRETPPEGAVRVATNLCGGGGKMLWEMTTGYRPEIFTLNESDTSGGLSAFKSCRILKVILSQENAQVLILTGSGMAFQNQHHLAAAVWKALRESPTPLPSLLRFGGTDEDGARKLFERVSESLPVEIRTYPAEIFPNTMADDLEGIALDSPVVCEPPPRLDGEPLVTVEVPPGRIFHYPELWTSEEPPPSVTACPTSFLNWVDGAISVNDEARCIGCLMCETAALLDGNGEIRIELDMPGEVR